MKNYICIGIATLLFGTVQTRASDDGKPPPSFESREEANRYVAGFFAGGRVDEVVLGAEHYLVLFQHGSGIPVLGFAQVYRRDGERWTWLAKAEIPHFEFVKAVAEEGKIVAIGEKSGSKTTIYDPKKG